MQNANSRMGLSYAIGLGFLFLSSLTASVDAADSYVQVEQGKRNTYYTVRYTSTPLAKGSLVFANSATPEKVWSESSEKWLSISSDEDRKWKVFEYAFSPQPPPGVTREAYYAEKLQKSSNALRELEKTKNELSGGPGEAREPRQSALARAISRLLPFGEPTPIQKLIEKAGLGNGNPSSDDSLPFNHIEAGLPLKQRPRPSFVLLATPENKDQVKSNLIEFQAALGNEVKKDKIGIALSAVGSYLPWKERVSGPFDDLNIKGYLDLSGALNDAYEKEYKPAMTELRRTIGGVAAETAHKRNSSSAQRGERIARSGALLGIVRNYYKQSLSEAVDEIMRDSRTEKAIQLPDSLFVETVKNNFYKVMQEIYNIGKEQGVGENRIFVAALTEDETAEYLKSLLGPAGVAMTFQDQGHHYYVLPINRSRSMDFWAYLAKKLLELSNQGKLTPENILAAEAAAKKAYPQMLKPHAPVAADHTH